MKRSWLALVVVAALGLLAGVAIAGRPTTVDDTVVNPVSTTAVPSTTSPTTTVVPTTFAVTGSVNRSTVRVLVANGTERVGIAGSTAATLVAAGFDDTRAVDAIAALAVSVVFARSGFELEAVAVAEELGLSAATVQELSGAAVTTEDDSADVIVAIGADFRV